MTPEEIAQSESEATHLSYQKAQIRRALDAAVAYFAHRDQMNDVVQLSASTISRIRWSPITRLMRDALGEFDKIESK